MTSLITKTSKKGLYRGTYFIPRQLNRSFASILEAFHRRLSDPKQYNVHDAQTNSHRVMNKSFGVKECSGLT